LSGTKVVSAEVFYPLELGSLPNGAYAGRWSAYEAITEINGKTYRMRTEDGVRGMNVQCLVVVTDAGVMVEAMRVSN
jgi:hypothetical protein